MKRCGWSQLPCSAAPVRCAGLYEAFITGGIPPGIDEACAADLVYRHTFARVVTQNEKYYQRFPRDAALAAAIVRFLAAQPDGGVRTPCGNWLRPRTFQLLGMTGAPPGGCVAATRA